MGADREHEKSAAPTVTPPTPKPAETAVPPAPVALPIGSLVVGHAEDRAESDADRMADTALQRLYSGGQPGAEAHLHGPGCGHLRRSVAPAGAPVVGYEGGALDGGTSEAIESERARGRSMPSDVRRRMETAFEADFSSVRIHDGEPAARLNRAVSARAFTTGNDIFFGRGQFAPQTSGGERVLAHELAHVVQGGGAPRRTVDPRAAEAILRSTTIRRDGWFTLPWRKTEEQKAKDRAADEAKQAEKQKKKAEKERAQARKDGGATLGEFSEKLKEQRRKQQDSASTLGEIASNGKANLVGAKPANKAFTDQAAAKGTEATMEVVKPSLAVGTTALAGAGTFLGHDLAAAGQAANAAGGTGVSHAMQGTKAFFEGAHTAASGAGELAGAGAQMVVPGMLVGDSLMGQAKAASMAWDAHQHGDAGMANLAGRKGKDQGHGLLQSSANTAKAGMHLHGALHAAAAPALATAGAAVGIGVGSAQVLQGAWRGSKAIMKLCRLTWGRAKTMLSIRGHDWKRAVLSAEKYKGSIAAMKVALGVLGIAAGALLIVSNPIGWGIGIAAAIAGGVYAGVKIAGKIKNARDRKEAADRIARGATADELFPEAAGDKAAAGGGNGGSVLKKSGKTGMSVPDNAKAKTPAALKRAEAIKQANELAREASANARLAHELRSALGAGDEGVVLGALSKAEQDPGFERGHDILEEEDRELHDSHLLLSSINVEKDEALSESGQELIEKKLSKVEAM